MMITLALVVEISGCASHRPRGFAAQREEIVTAAVAQIGVPYRYGQSQPSTGFDCSGLTQYAYAAAGLNIPRVSSAQRTAAYPIAMQAIKPGDLVFFATAPGQQHVGIMVDDDQFVHASTSRGRVRLASLNKAYWQKHLLGAGTFVIQPQVANVTKPNGNSPFGEL
ncbi:hypothetical protein CKO36_12000 [Rhabdochromatium marinum]|nr:hypothetical protein [Rhabdochromatium marinum]